MKYENIPAERRLSVRHIARATGVATVALLLVGCGELRDFAKSIRELAPQTPVGRCLVGTPYDPAVAEIDDLGEATYQEGASNDLMSVTPVDEDSIPLVLEVERDGVQTPNYIGPTNPEGRNQRGESYAQTDLGLLVELGCDPAILGHAD